MPSRPNRPIGLVIDVYELPTGSAELTSRLAAPCADCIPEGVSTDRHGSITRVVVCHAYLCPTVPRVYPNRAARRHPR